MPELYFWSFILSNCGQQGGNGRVERPWGRNLHLPVVQFDMKKVSHRQTRGHQHHWLPKKNVDFDLLNRISMTKRLMDQDQSEKVQESKKYQTQNLE